MTPLESLIQSGTRLWLDSIDPELVRRDAQLGATGATSNPVIVADLLKTGRFDADMEKLLRAGLDNSAIAWQLTDQLVRGAQEVFAPVWQRTRGDDGYVSFEIDPLLEDPETNWPLAERVAQYDQLARYWSQGHSNRMIKVPATPAGLASLEGLAAAGIPLNVTLIFSQRQYEAARDAVWRGAQRLSNLDRFKSVYSIFVSRVDVYTQQKVPTLSSQAQGQVGIVNAKRIWGANQRFWASHPTPLKQEIVFASTGTKNPHDRPWKYVEAFAGSDIQTNPPQTNADVQASDMTFTRQVDQLPPREVLDEIDQLVDPVALEETLMREGIDKFAQPQKALLALIESKRLSMAG